MQASEIRRSLRFLTADQICKATHRVETRLLRTNPGQESRATPEAAAVSAERHGADGHRWAQFVSPPLPCDVRNSIALVARLMLSAGVDAIRPLPFWCLLPIPWELEQARCVLAPMGRQLE